MPLSLVWHTFFLALPSSKHRTVVLNYVLHWDNTAQVSTFKHFFLEFEELVYILEFVQFQIGYNYREST